MSAGMPSFEFHDYWVGDTRSLPIVKEALTFVNTLQAGKTLVTNARVDAHTDNLAFRQSWEKQGCENAQLTAGHSQEVARDSLRLQRSYFPIFCQPDRNRLQISRLSYKFSPIAQAAYPRNVTNPVPPGDCILS